MADEGEMSEGFAYRIDERLVDVGLLFADGCIKWPGLAPLTVLIRGPEGSGKSTLALQLACLGQAQPWGWAPDATLSRCVQFYITDDFTPRILEKCRGFLKRAREVELRGPATSAIRPQDAPSLKWQPEPGQTHLYVFSANCLSLAELSSQIKANVASARQAGYQECVVVVDSITRLRPPPDYARDRIEYLFSQFPPEEDNEEQPVAAGTPQDAAARARARMLRRPWPAAIIMVDESEGRPRRDPYLTDVYIRLWQGDTHETGSANYCERYIQVVKAANCVHTRGPQLFRIHPKSGIEVLPSLAAGLNYFRTKLKDLNSLKSDPVAFGLDGLDAALGGDSNRGIRRRSSSLLIGPHGTLKTPLALQFCEQGLQDDEKVVFLSLHERPSVILEYADNLGMLERLKAHNISGDQISHDESADVFRMDHITDKHQFIIHHVSSAFMPPEAFIAMIRRLLAKIQPQGAPKGAPPLPVRIVIDAVSDFNVNYLRLSGVNGFFNCILTALYAHYATSLFVFDESNFASDADRAIIGLVDNSFQLHREAIRGQTAVLLSTTEVNRRLSGAEHVLRIEHELHAKLSAIPASGEFHVSAERRLLPVDVKLCVNRCSTAHSRFNDAVRRACDIPRANLDQRTAHESPSFLRQIVPALRQRGDTATVLAVDLAYLDDETLSWFRPLEMLDREFGQRQESQEDQYVNISGLGNRNLEICRRNKPGEKLRVLPTLVDCSLLLCNMELLERARPQHKALSELQATIRGHRQKRKQDPHAPLLPVVSLDLFKQVLQDFWQPGGLGADGHCFFGFQHGPNPEPLTCACLEWLTIWGIEWQKHVNGFPTDRENATKDWKDAMMELARLCMPPAATGGAVPGFNRKIPTPKNSLFFHTWHSLALSDPALATSVPVQVGERLCSTRGGWCWGVLDNNVAGKRGRDVLEYATAEPMARFLLQEQLGMPPRKMLCHTTGELSVHNIQLVREIIEEHTWSRRDVPDYANKSSRLYLLFSEFLSAMERLRLFDEAKPDVLSEWLDGSLAESIWQCCPQGSRDPASR